MAITTLDGIIAALEFPFFWFKAGLTMTASFTTRGWTPHYQPGMWPASAATAIGVNGEAVIPSSTGIVTLPRTNPTGGMFAYVGRFSAICQQAATLWLLDRLWHNSGLSTTLTTSQAITPAAITARDKNGANLGDGVRAAIEWSAAGGAGTPTATITYTNEAGTAGRTGTLTSVASPAAGTFELFSLQAGDKGIRSIQSFQWSATHTSGTFHLVLYRPIMQSDVPQISVGGGLDPITGGMPRVYDNTVYQLLLFPSSTSSCNMSGVLVEMQG